jgi:integrase/recombinase XerC
MKYPHQYAAGEKRCCRCKDPLPAVDVWTGRGLLYCEKPECRAYVMSRPSRVFIHADSVKCAGPDCDHFIPEGSYQRVCKLHVCSIDCWRRRQSKGCTPHTCACCGQDFLGGEEVRQNYFCSCEHEGKWKTQQSLERCGPFLPIAETYLQGYAKKKYRDVKGARGALCSLFEFLSEVGITLLSEVDISVINKYLIWGIDTDRRNVKYAVSKLRVFFDWARGEHLHPGPNPIVSELHATKAVQRAPRPLEEDDMDILWEILRQRGSSRLRLAAAIAEEAGLRGKEIANIRLDDMDMKRQKIFVRLPNKVMRERFTFFGEKTKRYYEEWMAVRRRDCKHDHLLDNHWGNRPTAQTIRYEFIQTLCKKKSIGEKGFERWSTHRLRHTFASRLLTGGADAAVIMSAGGWGSLGALEVYARMDPGAAKKGYDQAMAKAEELARTKPVTHTLTVSEFLARKRKETSAAA